MTKKTKKNEKNMKSTVFLLLFIMIGLITATYAWFTANPTVTVGTLDVNVDAVSGLQISVNGVDWKAGITKEDLINAGVAANSPTGTTYAHVNQLTDILAPVSSAGDVAGGRLRMFDGTVNANSSGDFALTTGTLNDIVATTGPTYIAFDMFLKTEVDETIYLTTKSSVTSTGATGDKGIKQATRVAFVLPWDTGNDLPLAVSSGDTIGNVQGQQPTKAFIWEPNYELHTEAGRAAALSRRGINLNTQYVNQPVPYDAVYSAFSSSIMLTQAHAGGAGGANAAYFKRVYPAILTNSQYHTAGGPTNYEEAFKLARGITKVRVYIWVEGQDLDCENNASGTNIEFNMQLSTDEQAI